jgi:hypothetical protein
VGRVLECHIVGRVLECHIVGRVLECHIVGRVLECHIVGRVSIPDTLNVFIFRMWGKNPDLRYAKVLVMDMRVLVMDTRRWSSWICQGFGHTNVFIVGG